MTPREITTLMHKLFYSDLPQDDGWIHLMEGGKLNRDRVISFLGRYFKGDEILLFVNAQHCLSTARTNAFEKIEEYLLHGTVKIADPKFHARALIHQIGVGIGSVQKLSAQPATHGATSKETPNAHNHS